jgi:hypothetical protein
MNKILLEKFTVEVAVDPSVTERDLEMLSDKMLDLDIDFEAIVRQKLEELFGEAEARRLIICVTS